MGNNTFLVWITGLSGSGKTTIGRSLYNKLLLKLNNLVFLDGDDFRNIFDNDLGHSSSDRFKNAMRISKMCGFLVEQKINVICSTMSLYKEIHQYNSENINNYHEVFIDCEIRELIRRDQKNLYSSVISGKTKNVIGIDLPYDKPLQCDITIDNTKLNVVDDKVDLIIELLKSKYYL